MATLWNKGTAAADAVENFTVGKDRELDMRLAGYDVMGSRAHIRMLESIGLLGSDEFAALDAALADIAASIQAGEFVMEDDVEDIHSQVELLLTRRLGETGKKIHSGRSRNDQVLVDLKLMLRDEIMAVRGEVLKLFSLLQELSQKYSDILLPGYTHYQVAMPSSFGLWLGAYAEALVNDMYMLRGAYSVVNRNPLGSAAGYGNSFPLDRDMTTSLLGFDSLDYNSIAAQLSRGKAERSVASAFGCIALTLNKFASDCCMYMCPNFAFIKFPDSLTTGSSIMPHKKNPDVWEMVRGKCNRIMASEGEISMLLSNMPHGYHRDYQLLKDIIFPVTDMMHECLEITAYMLSEMTVVTSAAADEKYRYMFTVEEVNRRVLDEGVPFRDAYRQVGIEVNEGRFSYNGLDTSKLSVQSLGHSHKGSIGNLCTAEIRELMTQAADFGQNWRTRAGHFL